MDDAAEGVILVGLGAVYVGAVILHDENTQHAIENTIQAGADFVGGLISQSRGGGNRLPPVGPPNSTQTNKPGTQQIKYGPDGRPVQEWNKGHPGYKPPEDQDHVHDHLPRPGASRRAYTATWTAAWPR